MTEKNPAHIERLVEHIAGYLADNPHAADTVAGIHDWWLAGAMPGASRREVVNAIHILVQRGTLVCRVLTDGTKIYARVQDITSQD